MDKDAEKRSMCGVRRTERNDDNACELGHLPTEGLALPPQTGSRLWPFNIHEVSRMAVQTSPFLHVKTFSYRFAEQVLNSRLAIKEEIVSVITDPSIDVAILSRPNFKKVLRDSFTQKGWQNQPSVFDEEDDPAAKMDF